jgi:hypothetical protein
MGKKKLDKLFQEKFENFSEMPEDKVWQSIETSLDQKKNSRKVIPIWWKLGGAAAVLAIAIFVINPFEENSNETPRVTDVNTPKEKTSEESLQIDPIKTDIKNATLNETQIVVSEEKTRAIKEIKISNEQVTSVISINIKNSEVASSKKQSENNIIRKINPSTTHVVSNATKKTAEEGITQTNQEVNKAVGLKLNGAEIVVANNQNETQDSSTKIANQNELDNNLNSIPEKEIIAASEMKKETEKKSIFDEIAAREEEKEVLVTNTGSKWSAGPSVAPVYFNAIGEGSPVHSIFVENSKSGDVNLSYGLSVAYEINKKLSVRSGIHKVDFGYNTNDVEFSSSVEASVNGQIDNVNYALTAKNLVVNSKSTVQAVPANQNSSLDATTAEVSATSASRDGFMEQQFGYLEVPVELNYALINKRFGVNLIGGVSSLFLVNNSVSLTSGALTTEMGKANNVNAVNFSTNVGFGVNYKFTSKLRLNIEPVFKYQLNTFSRTEGSFQPFSVGVYSGLSFRF